MFGLEDFLGDSSVNAVAGTGHEVDYTYDMFDHVHTAVYKNAAGTTIATITYNYDDDGNLHTRVDSHGTTTYNYDTLNRMTSESFPDGTSDTYTYDAANNLATLQDAGGTVTYGYDPANQLNSVKDPGASTATTLGYNPDGMITSMAYPSGAGVAWTYNGEDELTNVTDTYKTSGGATAHFSYTNSYINSASATTALVQTTTDGSSNVTTYSYAALDRLTDATTKNSGGTTLSHYAYKLDHAGNILQATNGGTTTSYGYNPGNEICWSWVGMSSAACGSMPTGGHTFTYDADGNETANNATGLTMGYNALGQMTSATVGGTATNYTYLGEGQDEIATQGSSALHNDSIGLASVGSSYFTRTDDDRQVSGRTSSGTSNYLYDAIGNVIGITNSSGTLVNQYSYDPYGNRTTLSGTSPNSFGFQTGFVTTPGLIHFGDRFVSPTQASWTQQDALRHLQDLEQDDRYALEGGIRSAMLTRRAGAS